MARGGARPGAGRPKNKFTARALRILMEERGYDPAIELIEHAQSPEATDEDRMDIAKVLMPYRYPRLSSVELDVSDGAMVRPNDALDSLLGGLGASSPN